MAKVKTDLFNFKAAFEELEQIDRWFQGENVDIDEALKRFKRGMELVNEAKEHLKKAENQFLTIKKELVVGED